MSRTEFLSLNRASNGVTGTRFVARSDEIAAGIAANSILWSLDQSLLNPSVVGNIERLRVQYTCIQAFAVPATAGRVLSLVQLSEAPTGGNASSLVDKLNGTAASSTLSRIADTAPLTYAGTIGSPIATMSLAGFGSAGDTLTREWEFFGASSGYLQFNPAIYGLSNPAAFGAGGTFELIVEVDLQGTPANWPG